MKVMLLVAGTMCDICGPHPVVAVATSSEAKVDCCCGVTYLSRDFLLVQDQKKTKSVASRERAHMEIGWEVRA